MTEQQHGPITFIVHGQALPGGVPAADGKRSASAPRALPGRVKAAVRLGSLRSATTPQSLVAVPGEDIVALHIAGGPVLLLHP